MYASAFRIQKTEQEFYRDLWPVDQHSISVVPDWLYKYLTNKGLGADYLLSDLALDKNLSVEDLAIIIYLNGHEFRYNHTDTPGAENPFPIPALASYHLGDEINRRRPINNERLMARIQSANNYAWTENVRKDVEERLGGICNENQPSYEFLVTGPKIWLIVKTGFLTMLKDPASRLSFYRDYLSTVGKIAPSRSVAHTAVFFNWVGELVG